MGKRVTNRDLYPPREREEGGISDVFYPFSLKWPMESNIYGPKQTGNHVTRFLTRFLRLFCFVCPGYDPGLELLKWQARQ